MQSEVIMRRESGYEVDSLSGAKWVMSVAFAFMKVEGINESGIARSMTC